MKNGRKTWFRQGTRIKKRKERRGHFNGKKRQNGKVKMAARARRKIKTKEEEET
jgi:hypothetical protein